MDQLAMDWQVNADMVNGVFEAINLTWALLKGIDDILITLTCFMNDIVLFKYGYLERVTLFSYVIRGTLSLF